MKTLLILYFLIFCCGLGYCQSDSGTQASDSCREYHEEKGTYKAGKKNGVWIKQCRFVLDEMKIEKGYYINTSG